MSTVGIDNKKSFIVQQEPAPAEAPVKQALELYHLSHDLRGPLNAVLGFSQLLLEGIEGPLNEHQQADIAAIHQSARNLLHLIDTVVDLSKLEAGKINFKLQPVDLKPVVEKVLAFDFGTNKPDQVALVATLPETLPAVLSISDRLGQMIKNLLRFGFKIQKTGQVTLSADHDDQVVTLQIRFSGATLPAEQVADLFELYVYVDKVERYSLGPGGMELPLVWQLAEKLNSRLWLESDVDSGTIFYLSLPVAS